MLSRNVNPLSVNTSLRTSMAEYWPKCLTLHNNTRGERAYRVTMWGGLALPVVKLHWLRSTESRMFEKKIFEVHDWANLLDHRLRDADFRFIKIIMIRCPAKSCVAEGTSIFERNLYYKCILTENVRNFSLLNCSSMYVYVVDKKVEKQDRLGN